MTRRATTKLTISRLRKAKVGSIVWDGELRGFGCRVTKGPTYTFIVQRDDARAEQRLIEGPPGQTARTHRI